MRVIRYNGSTYTLLDLVTNEEKQFHVKDLKAFEYDPLKVDPVDIATRDHQEYFVETVLDHRGDFKRVSSLEFKIHWRGYTADSDSWEPWSNVRLVQALHEYLRHIHKPDLIPKSCR